MAFEHRRFTDVGSNMARMNSIKIKFRKFLNRCKFSTEKYWELRYAGGGDSGDGSYGEGCFEKANSLNHLIEKYHINEIIEFGCGDGNQLRFYKIDDYLGLDVSKTAIEKCVKLFATDKNKSFIWYSPNHYQNNGKILKAQASLSVEVIFHLIEDEIYEQYMHALFSAAQEYVFIFSSNSDENLQSAKHFKNRKFTRLVDQKFKDWSLLEEVPVLINEKHFNNWFVFKKNCSL